MYGSGLRRIFCPTLALSWILTKNTPSPGSAASGKCCAAAAGPRHRASSATRGETISPKNAATSSPVFAPARYSRLHFLGHYERLAVIPVEHGIGLFVAGAGVRFRVE